MMMERKCSYCGDFGHNSRTCNNNSHHIIDGIINIGGGVKLFGVQLELSSCSCSSSSSSTSSSTSLSTQFASMKRSFSLDYLLSSSSSSPNFELIAKDEKNSDKTCLNNSTSQRRKKGVPWSEEEHRAFLEGLEKLGKGDWRGISSGFVTTRTPSQVASHAQKYFLRQNCFNRRKRRPSLLDVGKEEFTIEPFNNRYLKGSDELAYCGQIGWPSTNYLIPNKNKFCVHHQWFSYHHSVLNWPFISSTNHTTIIQSSEEEAPHLDLKLSLH